jgi:glutaredoxin/glutathione-dependent peroxiredoxin
VRPRQRSRPSWTKGAFRPDDGSVNGSYRCRFARPEYCADHPPGLRNYPLIEGELTMTIQVGDKLPEAKFRVMTAEGPQVKTTDDIFKGKKVALFAVPGAYTGTCHKMHLPSIFLNAYAIKDKGVSTIAIVSVNDAFVMNAWKRDTDQRDEAVFLADGNADFTKAIGMELDASGNGLGIRSKRYSMLVDDGVVKKLNLEPAPGKVEVSGGDTLLGQL